MIKKFSTSIFLNVTWAAAGNSLPSPEMYKVQPEGKVYMKDW